MSFLVWTGGSLGTSAGQLSREEEGVVSCHYTTSHTGSPWGDPASHCRLKCDHSFSQHIITAPYTQCKED